MTYSSTVLVCSPALEGRNCGKEAGKFPQHQHTDTPHSWWIDPMGAIILSALISFLWVRTAYSEFQLLIGVSADTSFLQHITYISMTHSPLINSLDTVRAWHSGPRLIVEVDIVMERTMTLQETHDVAEELQTKLESLPDVERCYVHVDYETSHAPEHFWKKEL